LIIPTKFLDHPTKFFFGRDCASLELEQAAGTPRCDFGSAVITLIEENAITENAMYKLKVLTAAVALLFVTPVLAQEMGGATGPGSPRGLEPSYNSGYYNGYDQGGPARFAGGALDGNNSYAMSPDDGYCAQRYRSYNPASGTYTGHDGRRHSCR
jgi:hypothetical protein